MASRGMGQGIALLAIGASLGGVAGGEGVSGSCWRPAPPMETDYKSREVFQEVREEYFAQASFYITCVDMWIEDARRRYQEMFAREVETYRLERQDVFDELRLFTGATR